MAADGHSDNAVDDGDPDPFGVGVRIHDPASGGCAGQLIWRAGQEAEDFFLPEVDPVGEDEDIFLSQTEEEALQEAVIEAAAIRCVEGSSSRTRAH